MQSELIEQPQSLRSSVLRSHDSLLVGGRWIASHSQRRIAVTDPAREVMLGEVPAGVAEDVEEAVAAACAARDTWAQTSVGERAAFLRALADGLERRAEELAVVIALESGSPLTLCRERQVAFPIAFLRDQARWIESLPFEERIGGSLIVQEPVGVVAAIAPWNFPLLLGMNKLAAALAAGCPVVFKPSELAPLHALLLAEVVDEACLPPGVFNLVTGVGAVVGEALAAHPDVAMVSLTGSTGAGRRVAELGAATIKRVALELGGKSACVILDDADLAQAVSANVAQCFWNSGQSCMAWSRMLVPRRQCGEAAELAVEASGRLRVGDPLDERTDLGPLISGEQRERVRSLIAGALAQGATLATGGVEPPEDLERGFYVQPTVLADVQADMHVAQQEIFGPVLTIIGYDDEQHALAIANGTSFGLHGAVFSEQPERAARFARSMDTGIVDVNGAALNPQAPFGGRRQSGLGRELGRWGIAEYLETKAIQLPAPLEGGA